MAGLTLDELVDRTSYERGLLEVALREEAECGRVLVDAGRYALRPGSLPPSVREALRGLARPDVAALELSRPERPAGGRLSVTERANPRVVVQ
jgi:hypothetical protein